MKTTILTQGLKQKLHKCYFKKHNILRINVINKSLQWLLIFTEIIIVFNIDINTEHH